MPNHFHFLIHANQITVETKKVRHSYKNVLSEGIRNLLQSYAKGINKQNHSTGSLFQQNTKAKPEEPTCIPKFVSIIIIKIQ